MDAQDLVDVAHQDGHRHGVILADLPVDERLDSVDVGAEDAWAARLAAVFFVGVLLKVLLDLRDERLRDVEDGGNFVLADAVSLLALEKPTDLVEARLRPEVTVPDLSEQLHHSVAPWFRQVVDGSVDDHLRQRLFTSLGLVAVFLHDKG